MENKNDSTIKDTTDQHSKNIMWNGMMYALISDTGLHVNVQGDILVASLLQKKSDGTLVLYFVEDQQYVPCQFVKESGLSSSSSSSPPSLFNGINRKLEDVGGNLINTEFHPSKRNRDTQDTEKVVSDVESDNKSARLENSIDRKKVQIVLSSEQNREIILSLLKQEMEHVVVAFINRYPHPSQERIDAAFAAFPDYSSLGMPFVKFMLCKQVKIEQKEHIKFLMSQWLADLMGESLINEEVGRIRTLNGGTLPL